MQSIQTSVCLQHFRHRLTKRYRHPIRADPLTSVYFPHDYLTCEAVWTDAHVGTRQVLALSSLVEWPTHLLGSDSAIDDDELMLNILRCQLTY